jgi:molecular chaperone DnaK
MAERIYAQQGTAGAEAGAGAGGDSGGGASGGGGAEDVVDAEFEEVKDDNKK